MILLNFTFALTVQQKKQIQGLLGLGDLQVREAQYTFNYDESFVPQAGDAFDAMELSNHEIKTGEFLLMPPGHPSAAVAIVLEAQKQVGRTLPCVRLKRVTPRHIWPARFEVAEIMQFEGGA